MSFFDNFKRNKKEPAATERIHADVHPRSDIPETQHQAEQNKQANNMNRLQSPLNNLLNIKDPTIQFDLPRYRAWLDTHPLNFHGNFDRFNRNCQPYLSPDDVKQQEVDRRYVPIRKHPHMLEGNYLGAYSFGEHQTINDQCPKLENTPAETIKEHLAHPENVPNWNPPFPTDFPQGMIHSKIHPEAEQSQPNNWRKFQDGVKLERQCDFNLDYPAAQAKGAVDVICGVPIPAKRLNEFKQNVETAPIKYSQLDSDHDKQMLTLYCAPNQLEAAAYIFGKHDNVNHHSINIKYGKGDILPERRLTPQVADQVDAGSHNQEFCRALYLCSNPYWIMTHGRSIQNFDELMESACDSPVNRPICDQFGQQYWNDFRHEVIHQDEYHLMRGVREFATEYLTIEEQLAKNTNYINQVIEDPKFYPLHELHDDYFDRWTQRPIRDALSMYHGNQQHMLQRLSKQYNKEPESINDPHELTDYTAIQNTPVIADVFQRITEKGFAQAYIEDVDKHPNLLQRKSHPRAFDDPDNAYDEVVQHQDYCCKLYDQAYLLALEELPNLKRRSIRDEQIINSVEQQLNFKDHQDEVQYFNQLANDIDYGRKFFTDDDEACDLVRFNVKRPIHSFPYTEHMQKLEHVSGTLEDMSSVQNMIHRSSNYGYNTSRRQQHKRQKFQQQQAQLHTELEQAQFDNSSLSSSNQSLKDENEELKRQLEELKQQQKKKDEIIQDYAREVDETHQELNRTVDEANRRIRGYRNKQSEYEMKQQEQQTEINRLRTENEHEHRMRMSAESRITAARNNSVYNHGR